MLYPCGRVHLSVDGIHSFNTITKKKGSHVGEDVLH